MAETASYPLHFSFPVSSLWWKLWTLDGNMIAWGRKKLYFLIFPAARYGMRLKWMICKQKVCVFFFFWLLFLQFLKYLLYWSACMCSLPPFFFKPPSFQLAFPSYQFPGNLTGSLVPCSGRHELKLMKPGSMISWSSVSHLANISSGIFLNMREKETYFFVSQYYFVICSQANPKWWVTPAGENSN